MSFGLCLQLSNHVYNRDMLGVFFEFVPQFLFLFCTFGYMIILILIKLTTDWTQPGSISPPNLIQTMIGMFLSPGSVAADKAMYSGQATVQGALLLIALLSVPIMLFVRPCYEYFGRPVRCVSPLPLVRLLPLLDGEWEGCELRALCFVVWCAAEGARRAPERGACSGRRRRRQHSVWSDR
jgi:vacuolar-type H+-ATPase subunit I/STV1